MEIINEPMSGLKVLKLDRFEDERGYFIETYNRREFLKVGIDAEFQQDNCVWSQKDVIRGLHCQLVPHEQGKLISCVQGAILDVAVDFRPESSTFLDHFSIDLTQDNNLIFWIPKGFAHGYSVQSRMAVVNYKCDSLWNPKHESGVRWDDPVLNIDWKIENPIVSAKDQELREIDPIDAGVV